MTKHPLKTDGRLIGADVITAELGAGRWVAAFGQHLERAD